MTTLRDTVNKVKEVMYRSDDRLMYSLVGADQEPNLDTDASASSIRIRVIDKTSGKAVELNAAGQIVTEATLSGDYKDISVEEAIHKALGI